jgi:tRNA modification GTPase
MSAADREFALRTDTVAAPVTPPGRGALATISVRGPQAWHAVSSACQLGRRASAAAAGELLVRKWRGPAGEPVVIHLQAPDRVDITCHGGPMPVRSILDDLAAQGVRCVPWQQLVRREATRLLEAEAIEALAVAPTLRTAGILLDQYHGALAGAIEQLRRLLEQGKCTSALEELNRLLAWAPIGLHLVEPWRVAIVGRPNVGKSSLLNALVGFDRAIVHPTAGTTRDVVTATTAIDGWPVELLDSAGIRNSDEPLESAGIQRARAAIGQSDWQLVVLDRSQPLTDEDEAILRSCPRPIVVVNKTDLPAAWDHAARFPDSQPTSALAGTGIAKLVGELGHSLVPESAPAGMALPFSRRHVALLQDAARQIRAGDPEAAIRTLSDLFGHRRATSPKDEED